MKLYIFDSHEKTAYQYYMCVVIAENLNEAIEIIKKALNDEDGSVREIAQEILDDLND